MVEKPGSHAQVVADEKKAEERYQAAAGSPKVPDGRGISPFPPATLPKVVEGLKAIREADADDFARALFHVIMPLPAPKQREVELLFEAFMDYALRDAESFKVAYFKKYQ